LTEYSQTQFTQAHHVVEARGVAEILLQHLNSRAIQSALAAANQPGKSSAQVQETFVDFALAQGFRSEAEHSAADAVGQAGHHPNEQGYALFLRHF
jgi:hypothetical protein